MPDYIALEGDIYTPWINASETIHTIVIKEGVTTIGDFAFYACRNLTSITIPNSVTSIGSNAFWGCTSLSSVTFPNSVTSIGDAVFLNCPNLTEINFPRNLKTIGGCTFFGCTKLTSITNPNPVPVAIKLDVFHGVNKSACTLEVPANAVSAYKNAEGWKEFDIVGI